MIRRIRWGTLAALAVLSTAACGSDEVTGPELGSLEVILTMEGADRDTNGGSLLLNDEVVASLALDVPFKLLEVEPGIHVIRVTGIALNCSAIGPNERNVTVRAGQTADEQFRFLCESVGGKDPGGGDDPIE